MTPEKVEEFLGIIALDQMINEKALFPADYRREDDFLRKGIDRLKKLKKVETQYCDINGNRTRCYVATEAGRQVLDTMYKQYAEVVQLYDVFNMFDTSAVIDWGADGMQYGEFAHERFWEMTDEEGASTDEWYDHISEERFENVLLAVIDYKNQNNPDANIDPLMVVFMTFLKDGRFDKEDEVWKEDLPNSEVFYGDYGIDGIIETAWEIENLEEADWDVGEIVKRGTEISINLIKEEEERFPKNEETEEVVTEETIIEESSQEDEDDFFLEPVFACDYYYGCDYYDPYYDPYYVSPCWGYDPWY